MSDTVGHPLQYAFVHRTFVNNTDELNDEQVRERAGLPHSMMAVERFNRCPTCEQWSPCDARKASTNAESRPGP